MVLIKTLRLEYIRWLMIFENIQINRNIKKPRVGVVGEILIKYHPFGNNYVIDVLEQEGAEVVMPDFMGFVKYMGTHAVTTSKLLKKDKFIAQISKIAIKFMMNLKRCKDCNLKI